MDQGSNGRFHALWRLVIILCTVLAVVTVLLVSFTKAPDGNAVPAANGRTQVTEPTKPSATPNQEASD